VALTAADVARRMHAVIRSDRRLWHDDPLHNLRLRRLVADMTERACSLRIRAGLNQAYVDVLRAVTLIANLGTGQQAVRSLLARSRGRVALEARLSHRDVRGVVEAKRDALRREDRPARSGVA
jgi:hypothetical protein